MTHENRSIRLTGDLYAFRIVSGVEQRGVGPLNADVLSFQSKAEVVKVPDKRRNRRGQNMKVFTDPSAPTGTVKLYSVPTRMLAMLMLGRVVSRSDSGGTVSSEQITLESDFWTPLAHGNVSSLTATSGVRATYASGAEGSDNAITWTAAQFGTSGNSITVALIDPSANSAALSVSVVDSGIVVNLATSGVGAITSTAAQVMAAIQANTAASALVTVANTGASDGSGVVAAVAQTNLTGGANTGGTSYTAGEDYEIDDKLGLVRPLEDGDMGTSAFVSYSYSAITGERIEVSTDYTVRTRLLLRGTNDADDAPVEWEAYSAILTPSGEFDLMSSDPVQAQFSMELETPNGKDHPMRLDFPVYAQP